MTPYYSRNGIVIYHADCRDVLPTLEAGSIDLVLTDPDYNGRNIGVGDRTYESGMPQMPPDEYRAWCQEWFGLAQRLTSRIALSCGIRNIWNYPPARWVLAWVKPGAVVYNGTGGFNVWEPILLYGEGIPKVVLDVYTSTPRNLTRGPERGHPCPKNPGLWEWLLASISRPGETVLDPFLGSGTTAVVAKKLGRHCIGIEIEEKYCEIAVARLRQEAWVTDEQCYDPDADAKQGTLLDDAPARAPILMR